MKSKALSILFSIVLITSFELAGPFIGDEHRDISHMLERLTPTSHFNPVVSQISASTITFYPPEPHIIKLCRS